MFAQIEFDFFRCAPPVKVAAITKQIRRRKKVQDEKDAIRAELRPLLDRAPTWLADCGVLATRDWIARRAKAEKAYKSDRSSVQQLKTALTSMQNGAPSK